MRRLAAILLGLLLTVPCIAQTTVAPASPSGLPVFTEEDTENVQAFPGRRDLMFNNDVRTVFNSIASAFGVKVEFDPSVRSVRLHFDLKNANFETAMNVAAQMTHTFWQPESSHEVLVAANTRERHQALDRVLMRTFYFPEATAPQAQELNEISTVLRSIFDIRQAIPQPATNSILVRAPRPQMEAAAAFIQGLSLQRPQVMVDVEVYEVSSTLLGAVGVKLPLQFQAFNVPSSVVSALEGPNAQTLLNSLTAVGGLSGLGSSSLSSLASTLGLTSQQITQIQSLLQNPVATFGGGATFFGVAIPPMSASFNMNESLVTQLQHTMMRATQNNPATLHIGTRYPVETQSFQSGIQVGATAQPLGFVQGLVPAIQYQDLGVTLKATPHVHTGQAVTFELELSVQSLEGQSFNGIPAIAHREYKGTISAHDEAPVVLAGEISETEMRSIMGLPLVSYVPLLSDLTSTKNTQRVSDELLLIITPHIVNSGHSNPPPIMVPAAQ